MAEERARMQLMCLALVILSQVELGGSKGGSSVGGRAQEKLRLCDSVRNCWLGKKAH